MDNSVLFSGLFCLFQNGFLIGEVDEITEMQLKQELDDVTGARCVSISFDDVHPSLSEPNLCVL